MIVEVPNLPIFQFQPRFSTIKDRKLHEKIGTLKIDRSCPLVMFRVSPMFLGLFQVIVANPEPVPHRIHGTGICRSLQMIYIQPFMIWMQDLT